VNVCQGNLKIFSGGGHRIIAKIITYFHNYDTPTNLDLKYDYSNMSQQQFS